MHINAAQLSEVLASLSSEVAYSSLSRASVFDLIQFESLTEDAKCELAKFLIMDTCPRIGPVVSNGDAEFFVSRVAEEIATWSQGSDIADRRLEHVAHALSTAAGSEAFARPPGALAAAYLLHQIEFLFRAMSKALALDGTFVSASAKKSVEQQLGRTFRSDVHDIVDTYQIMRLNTAALAPRIYGELDAQLPVSRTSKGKVIGSIGARIAQFRHPVSHGPLTDPSIEVLFYALLVSIALYGSTLFRAA
jgi:hypothetical protein